MTATILGAVSPPTKHTVPDAARELRAAFRDAQWQTRVDSWFSHGHDYATVVAIADPVRVATTWFAPWSDPESFTFGGADVQVRGVNHPPADFVHRDPAFPNMSPQPTEIELHDAVTASRLDLADVEAWARDLINPLGVAA